MSIVAVAVVVPCLNEEGSLKQVCQSLGFGAGLRRQVRETYLFIVDNNSTDHTLEVAKAVQAEALPGTVFIGHEARRGYVPPRQTGNTMVAEHAKAKSWDPSQVLILQADADSIYEEGYVQEMARAAHATHSGTFVTGFAQFAPEFRMRYPEYVSLCCDTDAKFFSWLSEFPLLDLVRCDAVSGYRLGDYFLWGGHQQEFDSTGEEVLAETTRLFLRGVAHGAQLAQADRAVAYPSQRKVLKAPSVEFATAGFPRTASWRAALERDLSPEVSLRDFRKRPDSSSILKSIRTRLRHLLALFGILPLHVVQSLQQDRPSDKLALSGIMDLLPRRSIEQLRQEPGEFLVDVLGLVDQQDSLLDDFLKEKL